MQMRKLLFLLWFVIFSFDQYLQGLRIPFLLRIQLTALNGIKRSEFSIQDTWTVTQIDKPIHQEIFSFYRGLKSKSECKKYVRKGLVYVNGLKVKNTHTIVKDTNISLYYRSAPRSGRVTSASFEVNLNVLWEDDHLAVIIKPRGLPVFNSRQSVGLSSVSIKTLVYYSLNNKNSSTAEIAMNMLTRPQPAHRLDKGTGGLLLIAKSRPALQNISKAFSTRKITKTYMAVVNGHLICNTNCNNREQFQPTQVDASAFSSLVQQLQDANISKHSITVKGKDKWRNQWFATSSSNGLITRDLDGKDAYTSYALERVIQTGLDESVSVLKLNPFTGRYHQIRRHLKMMGLDIVGDKRYGRDGGYTEERNREGSKEGKEEEKVLEDRLMLWATAISFPHPITGQEMHFQMDLPKEIQNLYDKI